MADKRKPMEWHPMDLKAALALTKTTESPDVVYPMQIKDAPANFTRMSGVCSYFVSGYSKPQTITGGLTVGGEMVIGRTDGDKFKGYNYVFATSSDHNVYFAGPYYHFYGHHIKTSSPVKVEMLFGHGQLSKHTKP